MGDGDALLKLSLVRIELAEMHRRGEVAWSDFTAANTAIQKEEQCLINELRIQPAYSLQMGRLFLDAVNELKSKQKISEKLAEKLILHYTREIAEHGRVEKGPEVPGVRKATEKPVEEPAMELDVIQPTEAEITPAGITDDSSASGLEVEIGGKITEEEREIERHAGFGRLFSAFLQERNIRWGEIVAALIMVGFAIPLSITVWRETGRIGKYLIFFSAMLVVFGAGWYVFSRLKLAITGKILLIIALLLIPLHFIALNLLQYTIIVNISILVTLGAVGYLIAWLIIAEGKTTFTIAYLLLCAFHLTIKELSFISRMLGFVLAGIAWIILAGGVWLLKRPQRKMESLEQRDADKIYLFLGVFSYAFILLFIRILFGFSPDITFPQLSPVLFLFALPYLYCGYQLLTKKADDGVNARAGGTVISISAYLVTVFSIIAASFDPAALMITAIFATAAYSYSTYVSQKAIALYSTIIAFAVVYITAGCILITAVKAETFSWFPLSLASTAAALVPLSLIYLSAGYLLKWKKLDNLTPHVHYTGVLLSIVLMLSSLEDIKIARFLLFLYAVVLMILTFLWQQNLFTYGAFIALVASALCFSISINPLISHHALLTAIIASIFFIAGYFISRRQLREDSENSKQEALFYILYGKPLIHSSIFFTAVSAIMSAFAGPEWVSLICGGVIVLNLLAYTLAFRFAFFVYAACASILVVIFGLCYRLGIMHFAAFIVALYAYLLTGLGYYLLRQTQEDKLHCYRELYAYPLVNSAIIISILSVFGLFSFYTSGRIFSAAVIAFLASIFFLLIIKVHPRELWVYPFQIFMTAGIMTLTWGLSEGFPGGSNLRHGYEWINLLSNSTIIFSVLANLWVISGLVVRKWNEAICSRLGIPVQNYDKPFFHWTTLLVSLTFLVVVYKVFTESSMTSALICQVLISSSLFILLYRGLKRYETLLFHVSCLFVFWWVPLLIARPSLDYITISTATYTALWYTLIRFKAKIRRGLEKIRMVFTEAERRSLLKIMSILIYCNTFLALLFAFIRISSIYGIIAIFMMAAIYFLYNFDRRQKVWGYMGIAVSGLGCYAVLARFLQIGDYGLDITILFGLLALGLAYFWEIMGVWVHKHRVEIDFFSEPCKWMGIVFTAVGFIFTMLFVVSSDGANVFQVSIGTLVLTAITVFYLWIAWVFQREVFVYIGEIALAMLFVFLRLAVPQWFKTGLLIRFWPLVIVGISFIIVGLSYWLQRLKLSLYVRPAYYTSIILPMVPFVGAWFVGIETSIQTLFGTGFFYSLVSYIRREKRYGYISAAVFNIAIQVLLIWQGIRFGVYPQVFVTPIGMTLIGISHLNKNRMDKNALLALRSFASAIIYASSTFELYTSESWTSPIILAGLCVLGILAGIALRIRPFLYLGTAFLLVDIFVQIYRTGRENTYIWWISGLAFGLTILILFAWFERRRKKVLALLKALKGWD